MWTFANILTVARLALLPLIVLLIYAGASWALWGALVLYAVGALTDFADGWVARKYNQISEFGTFLDPICDKIYVSILLIVLVDIGVADGLNILPVIVILTREFLVSGLREYLGPKGVKVPVTKLAKWKTASQMFCLGFLILAPLSWLYFILGSLLLWAAAALTAITGWGYLQTGLAHMSEKG